MINQKEKLLKAVELAKKPGGCAYLDQEGNPQCVIAQLYILEGGEVDALKRWEGLDVQIIMESPTYRESEQLKDYDKIFLRSLQHLWDNALIENRIEKIKKLIEEYYPE